MRFSELAAMDRVRVSCNSFARIRHPEYPNRLGLILNAAYLHNNGERILSPVGGGLEVKPAGRATLPEGCVFESKRSPNDLRFTIAGERLGALVTWFAAHNVRERETDVLRETREELGPDEDGPLSLAELKGARTTFAGFYAAIMPTRRRAAQIRDTLYLCEIYDTAIPNGIDHLAAIDHQPSSSFHFIRTHDIQKGQSRLPDTTIGSLCVSLLNSQTALHVA